MPKSKTDKSRKQKVNQFKQSKKMSNKPIQELRPFRQVPTWNSTDTFEVQGNELESIYNFFNIFAPAFTAVNGIFARGLKSGKITMDYEYDDGTPVSEAEVQEYTSKLNEYFAQKVKEQEAEVDETADTPQNATSKLVNINGYPASKENVSIED